MTRPLEKSIATASFLTAVALSFTSLLISDEHDVAANTMFVIAQFLTLCATILGIDYKFTARGDAGFTAGSHRDKKTEQ